MKDRSRGRIPLATPARLLERGALRRGRRRNIVRRDLTLEVCDPLTQKPERGPELVELVRPLGVDAVGA
jgi:hypothetical protein